MGGSLSRGVGGKAASSEDGEDLDEARTVMMGMMGRTRNRTAYAPAAVRADEPQRSSSAHYHTS